MTRDASDPSRTPSSGEVLDGWLLEEELGRGGMGVVFRAVQQRTGLRGALKVLTGPGTASSQALPRFRKEVRALARVEHEAVVRTLQESLDHDPPFFVMELLAGGSLADRIRRGEAAFGRRPVPLTPAELARLALELAEGLEAIHAQRILHRDLKPQNILFTAEGRAKLSDFGLAKILDATRLTLPQQKMGTFAYMAPETLRGGEADERTDLYQLGITLFEAATGVLPFSSRHLVDASQSGALPAPRLDSSEPGLAEVGTWLQPVLTRLMAADPSERFPSATELAAVLRAQSGARTAVTDPELSAARRTSRSTLARPGPSRSQTARQLPAARPSPTPRIEAGNRLAVFAGAGLLALAVLAVALSWQGRSGAGPDAAVSRLDAISSPKPVAVRLITAGAVSARLWFRDPVPPGTRVVLGPRGRPPNLVVAVPARASDVVLPGLVSSTAYSGVVTGAGASTPFGFRTYRKALRSGLGVSVGPAVDARDLRLSCLGEKVAAVWSCVQRGVDDLSVHGCLSLDGGVTWGAVESLGGVGTRPRSLAMAVVDGGVQVAWREGRKRGVPARLRTQFRSWRASSWEPVLEMPVSSRREGVCLTRGGSGTVELLTYQEQGAGPDERLVRLRFEAGRNGLLRPVPICPAAARASGTIRFAETATRAVVMFELFDATAKTYSLTSLSLPSLLAGTPPWPRPQPVSTPDENTGHWDLAVLGGATVATYTNTDRVVVRVNRPGSDEWSSLSVPLEGMIQGTPTLTAGPGAVYLGYLATDFTASDLTLCVLRSADARTWAPTIHLGMPLRNERQLRLAMAGKRLLAAMSVADQEIAFLRFDP